MAEPMRDTILRGLTMRRRSEERPAPPAPRRTPPPEPQTPMAVIPSMLPWPMRDGFAVRISGGTGPYSWVLQEIADDGTPVDSDSILGTSTLYDMNGASHNAGEIVWVKQAPGEDENGEPYYVIVSSSSRASGVILVTVEEDGTGTGTIADPFLYDLKDANTGAQLKNDDGTDATGLAPLFARQQFAVETAATHGHACQDSDGFWVLTDCDEVYERCA